MKTLFTLIIAALLFSCSDEIDHVTPLNGSSKILTIESNIYTEVKIIGFGSVWVDGKNPESIVVPHGTYSFNACGIDGEFVHDGKQKLYIECQ